MGCGDADVKCAASEVPRHSVDLSPFLIDETEVTAAQYAACVAAGHCSLPLDSPMSSFRIDKSEPVVGCTYGVAGAEVMPITCITWSQASVYCRSMVLGGDLPSEAQWEMAARMNCLDGVCTPSYEMFPWGNAVPPPPGAGNVADETEAAWYLKEVGVIVNHFSGYNDGYVNVAAVGSFNLDRRFLFDVAGNASEWIADSFDFDWYSKSESTLPDPINLDSAAAYRGIRGGAASGDFESRLAFRGAGPASAFAVDLGFRCASNFHALRPNAGRGASP